MGKATVPIDPKQEVEFLSGVICVKIETVSTHKEKVPTQIFQFRPVTYEGNCLGTFQELEIPIDPEQELAFPSRYNL